MQRKDSVKRLGGKMATYKPKNTCSYRRLGERSGAEPVQSSFRGNMAMVTP